MTDLADFTGLVRREHGLSVVSTLRANGTILSSVVNAGVLDHPVTGAPVIGFTTRRGAAKLAGPDDPMPGVDAERLRVLLRDVFIAAGGTHDDWATYDAVMAQEGRAAVLLTAERLYSNPPAPAAG
jgi:hypothetical protein